MFDMGLALLACWRVAVGHHGGLVVLVLVLELSA